MADAERDGASGETDAESADRETDTELEGGDAVEADGGHLEKIDDGCGCVGVWEALSEGRE